ncbi:MAG TPA: universal stress protein [Chitinophagaceae bacterium]
MKKILVPVDFSPASRNAEEYAASLAKAMKATLLLLRVYRAPAPAPELSVGSAGTGLAIQEENEEWIEGEVHFLQEKYGIEVRGMVRTGFKGDTINEVVKESEADLVVMGMKEARRHNFPGSTVYTSLRKLGKPVLVVPEGVSFKPIRNIVLAADFTVIRDLSCYDSLFDLVESWEATLQVVHVAGKEAAIKPDELSGKLQLQRALSKVTYWYHELDEDRVEESLLRFTESHPADILVMVAHHHNFLERFFGTLYTRDMSYKAAIPLLVLEDRKG